MHVQCEVSFQPATFAAYVNKLAQNISVSLATNHSYEDSVEPTRDLVTNAFASLNYLSGMVSTLYTSLLDNTFIDNMLAVQQRGNQTSAFIDDAVGVMDTAVWDDSTTPRVAEDSMESLSDKYLGAPAASQLMLYHRYIEANSTTSQIQVVRLGIRAYNCASVPSNLAMLVILLYELVLMRFWRDLPSFNS